MNNKVLVISGTMIDKNKSYSHELLTRFVSHYQEKNPKDEIINLDLNTLPFASETLNSENFDKIIMNKEENKYIKQLKSVNKVIISSPMNNFNVTGLVKNYLDHILVANQTFSYKYTKKGDAIGLLTHLKVQILTTQGAPYGWYLWGNHTEFLKGTWKFVGAKISEPILIAGTKTKPFNQLSPSEVVNQYENKIREIAYLF